MWNKPIPTNRVQLETELTEAQIHLDHCFMQEGICGMKERVIAILRTSEASEAVTTLRNRIDLEKLRVKLKAWKILNKK